MNVYQNLEVLKNPSFSAYFAEAEAQKEEIFAIIFNKDKIINFNKEYEIFSEENLDRIMTAIDELLCDEGYISLCCAMYLFMKKDISIAELKPPEDGSLKSEFALMPPLIANAVDFCDYAISKGVDKEILSTTLKAVNMYINSNANRKGRPGTSGYHTWLPRYAQGKLFRIGAFQFEIRSFRGKKAIGVHIPNGTKLDVKENMENFSRALEFFNKCYSEFDFKAFVCESWLLNPHIETIMGRQTNITRFGDMFERFEIDEEDDGVFISVFKVLKPNSIDELREETSLQRNIKIFLKDGNRFKDYGGFISIEKIKEAVKTK